MPDEVPTSTEIAPLLLEGSAFERGITHGRTLRDEIGTLIGRWHDRLEQNHSRPAAEFIAEFLEATNFADEIEQRTPTLLDEVRGMSEGANIDFSTLLAFQFLDEILLTGDDPWHGHCSSLGIDPIGDQPTIVAQNWDFRGYADGFQTVLRIREPGKPEALVFTVAGFIGALGLNAARIAVAVNSLSHLSYARDGLPVSFVIRGLLEQADFDDAVRFLDDVSHASPQNYVIGGPEGVADFEVSAGRIARFCLDDDPGFVCHTNHALVNDDFRPRHRDIHNDPDRLSELGDNSHTRYADLLARLSRSSQARSPDGIKATLRSHDSDEHPICMSMAGEDDPYSLASSVMLLSDPPEMHLALGAPDARPYRRYGFADGR